jgi:hypothetical protein
MEADLAKKKKPSTLYIPVKDYGDEWINRLAAVCVLLGKMSGDERVACLGFLQGKYNADWPRDAEY